MPAQGNDTIVAVATPPGRGGVGIVRVSGPDAERIAGEVLGSVPAPRHASYCSFRDSDGEIIDQGLALFFSAPASFTGEDIVELQGHGGPVVMDMLVRRITALGARLARPGEFSERAFLNDRLDLAQAEAIADLIESASEQAARAAVRSLEGEFSARVHALGEALTELRMYVEAAIDFAEEEIDFLADRSVGERLQACADMLEELHATTRQGVLLKEGMQVVIAGRPNVGKSSLLNHLAGRGVAIVTEIAGTTRDVLREYIHIDGMPLHVIDTAGLREGADVVEQEGIRRAWREIERADRVLLVVDARSRIEQPEQDILDALPEGVAVTVVYNKIDLADIEPGVDTSVQPSLLRVSAKTDAGMHLLREHLKACMGYQAGGEGRFIARRRHLDALQRAGEYLRAGREQLDAHRAGELLAEDLRLAHRALGEITGEFTSDDLLGRIFASFCIGK